MKLNTFLVDSRHTRSVIVLGMLAITVLSCALLYTVVKLGDQHERIVLVPPDLDQRAQIAWESANQEYIKSFAMYMATLIGNLQPKTSATVLDSISIFLRPTVYSSVRTQLLRVLEDPVFRSSGSVFSFMPQAIRYEPETRRAFVSGRITTLTGGGDKYTKAVTYEMTVQIRQGRPYVLHFTSYDDLKPHTARWWERESQRTGDPIPAYAVPRAGMLATSAADDDSDAGDTTMVLPTDVLENPDAYDAQDLPETDSVFEWKPESASESKGDKS